MKIAYLEKIYLLYRGIPKSSEPRLRPDLAQPSPQAFLLLQLQACTLPKQEH